MGFRNFGRRLKSLEFCEVVLESGCGIVQESLKRFDVHQEVWAHAVTGRCVDPARSPADSSSTAPAPRDGRRRAHAEMPAGRRQQRLPVAAGGQDGRRPQTPKACFARARLSAPITIRGPVAR